MDWIIAIWIVAGVVAGQLAFRRRMKAGQSFTHALIQSTITAICPVLLPQDYAHARNWEESERILDEDKPSSGD